jgi:glyoxylase-like metal-dependent hydrolase (beta-lactamase superfamily II)
VDGTEAGNLVIFRSFPVPPLGCNCSIIGDPTTKEALVVDPGGDSERILKEVEALGLTVTHIVHTHAHFDHFLASGRIKEGTGAPLWLHKDDKILWDNLEIQCRTFGVEYTPVPPPDRWLKDDEELALGEIKGLALHTPGHTPGSMCFHFPSARIVIAGDTLFRESIGRTDLWGGDAQAIERSIKDRLYALDEETRVITGHGPETRIGHEVRFNPFVPG